MLPSLTRLSIGCDATDTATDTAGGTYVEKKFALTSTGFAEFKRCIINNSENIEEYGTKVCFVSSICNAEAQAQNEITVRFYFNLETSSNFKDGESATEKLTYRKAFDKVVDTFNDSSCESIDGVSQGASNYVKSGILYSTEGNNLAMRTSLARRNYLSKEPDKNIMLSVTSPSDVTDLALQLQELFLTLALNCKLSDGSTFSKGAFVEQWDLSKDSNTANWTQPFFAVTMISENHTPLSQQVQTNAYSFVLFLDLTEEASKKNVILFDNKTRNGLCRDESTCYLIDFDTEHTKVLLSLNPVSTLFSSLINSMVVLMQINLEMSRPSIDQTDTEVKYILEKAYLFFLTSLKEIQNKVEPLRTFFNLLFEDNPVDIHNIQRWAFDCRGRIVAGNRDTMQEIYLNKDGKIARSGMDINENTLGFSYDPMQQAVQTCLAKKLMHMTSFYATKYNNYNVSKYIKHRSQSMPWLEHYVKNMLLTTTDLQKKDLMSFVDNIKSVLNQTNLSKKQRI